MQFYWVRDQVEQKHFEVKWKPGHMNIGDNFTKNHPPTHHRSMRQTYLVNVIIAVQECILRGFAKTRGSSTNCFEQHFNIYFAHFYFRIPEF